MSWNTMADTSSTQGMRHAPGHRATTTVFLLAAATAGTIASCQLGRERSGRSMPSPEVVATFMMTMSNAAARAAAVAGSCVELYVTL